MVQFTESVLQVSEGGNERKRIRSVPGNRVLPVNSSAMMQPTDQMSTEKKSRNNISGETAST